jgi:hypothetical protein
MAEVARAEQLVQTMEHDPTFVGGLTDDEVGGVAAGDMGVVTLAAMAAAAAGW